MAISFSNNLNTHLFILEPKQPYVINVNSSRIFNIQSKANDKIEANYFYGDYLLVEFKTKLVLLNLKTYQNDTFELVKGLQISIPFFDTMLKITF